MRIEQTGIGSSVEEAYENAKALLAAPEEAEVKMEIIQNVKKKLFGLKTEPAKVLVWYEKEDPAPKAPERKPEPAEQKPQNKKPEKEKNDRPYQKKAEKHQQKKEQPKAPAADTAKSDENEDNKRIPVELPENDRTAAYIKMIVNGMGIEQCDISLEKTEKTEEYIYTISCGEDDRSLIGKRGETLDAIQYLARLSENKGLDEDKHRKISINIGDYRERRNDTLKALAHKNARRVLKYGRNVALEPMSPYERRIIHTAIQEIEGVTSHSVGSDGNRKVIITLEEGVTPTNPSSGRGSGRGGRRDGRSRQKKEPYKPEVTREPRKDLEGSLYGKIEIPAKPETGE